MVKTKKDKRTNNDLQNTTHKTKDRVTHVPCRVQIVFLYPATMNVCYAYPAMSKKLKLSDKHKNERNK